VRQEELAKAWEGLADLPGMLKERIIVIKEYLDDVGGGLGRILDNRRTRRSRRVNDDAAADNDDVRNDNDGNRGNDNDDNNDGVVRDVVNALVLHGEDYDRIIDDADDEGVSSTTSNRLVAAFTTERWCDLSLLMLSTPSDVIGAVPTRGIRQRALTAVRALALACRERSGDATGGWIG